MENFPELAQMAEDGIHPVLRNARHIVVMKLRELGDSVWMLPFVDNLKRNLPQATVTVVVNQGTEPFFRNRKSVDAVMPFPRKEAKKKPFGFVKFLSFALSLRRLRPDVVIELTEADRPAILAFLSGAPARISYMNERRWRRHLYTHFIKSKAYSKHFIDYHLDALRELGLGIFDDSIKIDLDPGVYDSLRGKMPSAFEGEKKKVVIHPGAGRELKQWGAGNFARLADMLSEDCGVFVLAGPNETSLLDEVLGHMKTRPAGSSASLSVYEFAALCELCDMFIGNDSGPMHIASAETFTVGIFGPTWPKFIGPWTDRKLEIFDRPDIDCRPCMVTSCHNPDFWACLRSTRAEDVARRVRDILFPDDDRASAA